MSATSGALALCLVLSLALSGCSSPSGSSGAASSAPPPESAAPSEPPAPAPDLAAARSGFVTTLRTRGPSPQEYQKEAPPKGVQEVEYTSGDLKLKAWTASPPVDSVKVPAVVFLHGGFSFGAQDWADASPILQGGFLLFMPMLRGENGNPGSFESFYGEVSDALAAGEYVKSLPHVEADHIFLAGHSAGGVLAVLASMMPSVYRSAASLSGSLDMRAFARSQPGELVPYDKANDEEITRRNPYDFVPSLRIPLVLFADPANLGSVTPFAEKARELGKPCEIVEVPGDHTTMVPISVIRLVDRLRADAHLPPMPPKVLGSAGIQSATVSGGTVANASAVVAGMAAGFRRCYNKGLKEDPQMKGSLRVTAHIGPNGEVQSAHATVSPAPPAQGAITEAVRQCIQARVVSAQFAPPDKGGATIVIPVTLVTQ